jgi:hypothetical protein
MFRSTTTMNKRQIRLQLSSLAVATLVVAALSVPFAYAQSTADSEITQEINEGVLSTSIRDGSGVVVGSPSFAMTAVSASTSQQTATGTFGSASQRITVDNPGGADAGWTLALNATTPGTGEWVSGSDTYEYNGATAAAGQLTVNPAAGSLTAVVGGATGVSLGSQSTFTSTTPITILSAAAGSADIWNGYVTGIGLSQTIPPAQPIGNYTIDMTQTVTAL